jgi:HepT-like protein
LIDEHRSLLESCASREPNAIELSALATFLHSFYSGIENSLKRIAVEIDGGLPSGDAWHRQLLMSMTSGTNLRPPVLSNSLYEIVSEYLAFRHFFRQTYSFHFEWSKMSDLVLNAEQTMRQFETEIDNFLDSLSRD